MSKKNLLAERLESRLLFTAYDAAADFSLQQNPNGPWSYGVRFNETADYAPFPVANGLDFAPLSAAGWNENSGSPPYIGINTTGAELDSEGIDLPAGVLIMHPGGNGEYADLRFTAPAAANLAVSYTAVGIDTNGTTTDEHVLQNNQEIGSGSINGFQQKAQGSYKISVVAGDTLDFLVGTGSNNTFFSDATSMSVQIIPTGSTENHLVFSQQPKDGDERIPEPTQVKIEDSKNHVVTSATDGVTLFDVGGNDVGYVPFVHGVAAFTGANAPILLPGTQTLVAEETNAAHQFSGSAGQVTSTAFHISELHLAFTREPISTGADVPFAVTVQLEDDKNRPVKVPEANPFISFIAVNESNSATVSLSTTAFVNGRPVSLSIPALGTFILIASQVDSGGTVVDPNSNGVSGQISVLGNHLRFIAQPGNVDSGAVVRFIVGLVDYKNKFVSPVGLTGTFNAGLLNDGDTVQIIPITLVNGKYDNSKATNGSPLIVPSAGSYTIIVEDDIPGSLGDAADDISPIMSLGFQAIAPHLVFTRQPTTTGEFVPVSFAIELLNRENKPVSPDTGDELGVGIGPPNLPTSTVVTLQNGKYDNLKPPAGQVPLDFSSITNDVVVVAELIAETNDTASLVAMVQSTPFSIVADHLVFKRQPSTVAANTPLPFQVVLEDPKNQPLTLPAGFSDYLYLGLNTVSGTGTIPLSAFPFSSGQFDDLTDGGDAVIKVSGPGTYTLTAELGGFTTGGVDPNFSPAISKVFKIK